jgi:hypothetical protein
MQISRKLKLLILLLALVVAAAFVASCRGSKANVRKEEPTQTRSRRCRRVTTAAAIKRELPRFFEATGSLAGDQQTDVRRKLQAKSSQSASTSAAYVKRGQMLVRLTNLS